MQVKYTHCEFNKVTQFCIHANNVRTIENFIHAQNIEPIKIQNHELNNINHLNYNKKGMIAFLFLG